MRAQLETLMDEDLQLLVKQTNLPELKALHEWLRAVQELDKECQKINQCQDKHITDLIENSIHKRPNLGPHAGTVTSTQSITNPPNNTQASTLANNTTMQRPNNCGRFPPPLMENERLLLCEHEGCTRCHVFYAGHTYTMCSNVPPTCQDYIECMLQDALHMKAWAHTSTPQAPPIATI